MQLHAIRSPIGWALSLHILRGRGGQVFDGIEQELRTYILLKPQESPI